MAKKKIENNNEAAKSIAFETLNNKQLAEAFETDLEKGLTTEQAKTRLEKNGENKLAEKKKKSVIRMFFEQMKDPMIYVLFAAIALTIGVSIYETLTADPALVSNWFLDVGDWPDVIIIMAVIIINSIIGTVQEVKAQTSLEALKKLSSPESTVIRDGKHVRVKASELVVGDIVVLEEGDTVGADIRLIESSNLKANESSLTGESVPVEKDASVVFSSSVAIGDRVNEVYMSTPITYGRGKGIVVNTAMKTEIGKIAKALDNDEEELTPLQKVLEKLGKILGIICAIIVVVVFVVDALWIISGGVDAMKNLNSWIDALLSSIALAVAAIPEGLATVVTIVLSIGVSRMVKANTIVRKLPSVETLGAVSVVCSDKTGTLTQNKMTVLEAYTLDSYYKTDDFVESNTSKDLRLLAKGMSLCSNASVDEGLYGDPTEIALVAFANQFNMHKKDLEKATPRINELPFDSVRKMMTTLNNDNGNIIHYTKGALDSILKHTNRILDKGEIRSITKEDIDKIYEANSYFSDKALRVLALAYDNKEKIEEENLIFIGLVAMIDPPRAEAKPAVSKFKEAGITTVMITGDHKDTAFAIASELGIVETKDQCIMGEEIDKLSEEELKEVCKTCRVFARVSPENKVSIVKAFKANGNICAMTGDGVNDAPSLKAADIGIAMGITGTDVAKGAADMVLTDDNFASIEKAVEEGRGIFANIKKTVLFLLSSNFAEVFGMLIIIILGFPAPFIAIHLLWVNLITDSLPAIALGMDPKDPNNMKQKPRNANESLFAHGGWWVTGGYGIVITLAVIIAYLSAFFMNGMYTWNDIAYCANEEVIHLAQTMAFTTLAFSELFHMLGMSNMDKSVFTIFKNKNYMMLVAFIVGVALQLFVVEVPGVRDVFNTAGDKMNWTHWLITMAMSLLPLIVHEIVILVKFIIKKTKHNK
ncbi:MAG: cation-translocating P-type ATPase [Bacilli bacterium]|nr:cation-translocating P-type ATPase [Bacilli bacterium]MDY5832283.1 cation-translocating P-type ATPase [Candidatus Onthovivens sp.]